MQLDKASSTPPVDQETLPAAPVTAARGRRLALPTWVKLLLGNPLAATGIAVLAIFILAAIFAPLLTPYDPTAIGSFNRYLAPSRANLFGSDYSGIDVFTEVLYGARASLTVGA